MPYFQMYKRESVVISDTAQSPGKASRISTVKVAPGQERTHGAQEVGLLLEKNICFIALGRSKNNALFEFI